MTQLIEDYLREVDASLRVEAARKRQIVDELRSHLTEKIEEIRAESPERALDDIERDVLREFGSARDLALAYEPEGTAVLKNQAGDIVLRLGKAVGRGAKAVGRSTGTVLKWTAVALGVLLVISLGVGAWAYYEIKPYIPAIIEQSEPSYQFYERCGETPCNGALPGDSFYVSAEARTVRWNLDIYSQSSKYNATGSVRVHVTDPNGTKLLDRSFNISRGAAWNQEVRWAAVPGNWTVGFEFEQFVGSVDARASVATFPWNDE